MRHYELAYIAHPELDDPAIKALEEKVAGWVTAAGGKVGKIDRWGKRKLANPIEKQTDGFYVFIQLELPPQAGVLIERDLGLSEQILRYMITLQESS